MTKDNNRQWSHQVHSHILLNTCDSACNKCGKVSEDNKRCAKCRVRVYCSKECQVQDWKGAHKAECKKIQEIRASKKSQEKLVQKETGKNKKDQRNDFAETMQKLKSMPGLQNAIGQVAHMVCMGGNLPQVFGNTKPAHGLFVINMTAWDVFAQSSNDAIRATRIVTVIPNEYLTSYFRDGNVVRVLQDNQAKVPVDQGCIWMARPDRSFTDRLVNSINVMPYPGSMYHAGHLVGSAKQRFLQTNQERNRLISRNLAATHGEHPQIPTDLMNVVSQQDPPNWEALANKKEFQSIVETKCFGVVDREAHRKRSKTKAIVTLFINVNNTNSFCISSR